MFVSRKQLGKLLEASYIAGAQVGLSLGTALSQPGHIVVGGYSSKMERDIDEILKTEEVEPWKKL